MASMFRRLRKRENGNEAQLKVDDNQSPYTPKKAEDIESITPNGDVADHSENGHLHSPCSTRNIVERTNLEEELFLLADEQPTVARCTAAGEKYTKEDERRWHEEHDMRHAVCDRWVYDMILNDSVRACDNLQHSLQSCVDQIRLRSLDIDPRVKMDGNNRPVDPPADTSCQLTNNFDFAHPR